MREAPERTIGTTRYRLTEMPWKDARKGLMVLKKAAAPALREFFAKGDLKDQIDKKGSEALAANAIAQLLETVNEKDLDTLTGLFMNSAKYSLDGGEKWPPLDERGMAVVFKGGALGEYFQWLKFGIEVNYSDFLDSARSQIGALARSSTPTSKSPGPTVSSTPREG
jgi:hypothetical protein